MSLSSGAPLVSVLIPAYGVASCIAEALASVFAQEWQHGFEVIVVNDGSPDTAEMERAIAPFRDRITYHKQRNGGPASARNTALNLSDAPFIALLDGDDVYLPHYLRVQADIITSDLNLALVYGDMECFGGTVFDGKRLSAVNREIEQPSLETLIRGTATVLNSAMVRREAILAAGGWDPGRRYSEDYDLWLRIAAGGGKLKRHDELIGRYRMRPDGLSRNEGLMQEGRIYAFTKLLNSGSLPDSLTPIVEEKIEASRAEIALCDGKQAFKDRKFALAAECLNKASAFHRSLRLGMIARLLAVCPSLLYFAFSLRSHMFHRFR